MRAPLRFALILAAFFATSVARADAPSTACKDGAVVCRDAYAKLEKCSAESGGKPDACTAAKAETDNACMTTTSACHLDGSRKKPRAH